MDCHDPVEWGFRDTAPRECSDAVGFVFALHHRLSCASSFALGTPRRKLRLSGDLWFMAQLTVQPIPCLRDNYAYLVRCESTGLVAVVDPSEAEPIQTALRTFEGELTAIWNTHHHWDHTGGNEALVGQYPGLQVLGHHSDRGRIPGQTDDLEDGSVFTFGELNVRVRHVPGHTTGSIAYFVQNEVFTGDMLFIGGCGRLFEGTPSMLFESLSQLKRYCRPENRLWVGHEYTESNLRFAQAAEPQNEAIRKALERSQSLQVTIPGSWADELATNPFVRAETVESLGALRAWKDEF